MDKGGFVYLVYLGFRDTYKIGKTRDMPKRIKELMASNPHLKFVHCKWVPNCGRTEKDFHEMYKSRLVEREIFKLSNADVNNIINMLNGIASKANKKRLSRKGTIAFV